jgi:hypothetical protein
MGRIAELLCSPMSFRSRPRHMLRCLIRSTDAAIEVATYLESTPLVAIFVLRLLGGSAHTG